MNSRFFSLLLPLAAHQLPLLVVWAVGLVISIREWANHPASAKPAAFAFGLFILATCMTVLTTAWTSSSMLLHGPSPEKSLMAQMVIAQLVHQFLMCMAFGLLIFGLNKAYQAAANSRS